MYKVEVDNGDIYEVKQSELHIDKWVVTSDNEFHGMHLNKSDCRVLKYEAYSLPEELFKI